MEYTIVYKLDTGFNPFSQKYDVVDSRTEPQKSVHPMSETQETSRLRRQLSA